MVVQLNTGYLNRGVIVMEKKRAISRYLHYYFLFDLILVIFIAVALISQYFYLNYFKLMVVFKFVRMFEIDDIFMRKLAIHLNGKVTYVIIKQIITIFNLSHTIGLIFYLIDLALTNDPICQG